MTKLETGYYYHIYNHANGHEDIFREEKNYTYFLEKYRKYIHPVAETFAYCLMKNHFHFLVRIREDKLIENEEDYKTSDVLKTSDVSYAFKNFFQSYTKGINKVYNRPGSLFNQKFKRKQITTDLQFQNALIYIHMNPVKHGFCETPGAWKYSSFNAYIKKNQQTLLLVDKGTDWFGDLDNLIKCHKMSRLDQFENECWE
jgi:putative transposase